jgi:hypothetical protein
MLRCEDSSSSFCSCSFTRAGRLPKSHAERCWRSTADCRAGAYHRRQGRSPSAPRAARRSRWQRRRWHSRPGARGAAGDDRRLDFRDPSVGNPQDIYQLVGSYLPFAQTRAAREANGDPRLSLEERYRSIDDYLQRVRSSAMDLVRRRYLLAEDLESIIERARMHSTFATREEDRRSASGR